MGLDFAQLFEQLSDKALAFFNTSTGHVTVFLAVMLTVVWLLRRNSVVVRGWKALEETMFSSWQLTLLGVTGLVLSAASGWTTWDGMRNFTGEPILSAMITFGIQGVMLIVAWLIGESFATGMSHQRGEHVHRSTLNAWIGALLGVVAALGVLYWMLHTFGGLSWSQKGNLLVDWSRAADVFLWFAGGTILIALMALNRRGELALPYVQSARIIIRNMVLWVMFLACMATSVFFSFDSLFTAIFPQEERVRAADLRAQNQVAGIVADIDETIRRRRLVAVDELFASESWKAYDAQLVKLAGAAQASTAEIEKFFNDQIEARNRAIKEQQERIATSQSTQAGIAAKKTTLVEELTRLKNERGTLAADFTEKKTELDARTRSVDAKRVEAMAEEQGAEGTLKQGRGPQYRQIMADLAQLQAALKIQEDRVRDAQRRLSASDTRITQIERELASIDGDLATLKGEAQTAEQRIRMTQDQGADDPATRVDPARVLPAFEAARAEFRQQPDAAGLMKLQQQCTQVVNAMLSTEITKPRVRSIDCDPKQAAEAAAVVFALNAGAKTFGDHCIGGERLAEHKGADALFGFARKCLADSGLPSRETDQLRTKINFIELNRDDKAHRFVVTWNAFQDGNRLAYLALAIAIAIDSLIFMSGLFGANALRSPLSDVPSDRARSASQLEAIIDTALIPHKFDTARLVLGAMRPITLNGGYMARIDIADDDPHAADIRRVLNAGSTIGAVRDVGHTGRSFEVRAELFEYLSQVAKREFESNREHGSLADLERTVAVALLPNTGENASMVLSFMHPIREQHGFMAEIRLAEVAARSKETGHEDERCVRNALNAGAMFQRVQRVGDDAGHFFIHGDFYKVLVRLRARMMTGTSQQALLSSDNGRRRDTLHGGRIGQSMEVGGRDPRGPQRLTDETRRVNPGAAASDAASPAIEDWERHCRQVLFAALHLDRATAAVRLEQESVRIAALAAWKQLNTLADTSGMLERFLSEHRRVQEETLDQAYVTLKREADGQQDLIDVLDEIDNFIQGELHVIMLFPENGLIDYVIDEIERAAQSDAGLLPGEQLLKDHLIQIRQQMLESDLGRADTWQGVTEAFRALVDKRGELLRRFTPRRGEA